MRTQSDDGTTTLGLEFALDSNKRLDAVTTTRNVSCLATVGDIYASTAHAYLSVLNRRIDVRTPTVRTPSHMSRTTGNVAFRPIEGIESNNFPFYFSCTPRNRLFTPPNDPAHRNRPPDLAKLKNPNYITQTLYIDCKDVQLDALFIIVQLAVYYINNVCAIKCWRNIGRINQGRVRNREREHLTSFAQSLLIREYKISLCGVMELAAVDPSK